MTYDDEIREKEKRVRELIRSQGLGAILLKRQANFSWMTGGGLNLVGITTEVGATSLLITAERKFVVSNNIEAPRMLREERLEEQGFTLAVFPWYEDREVAVVRDLTGSGKLGSAIPLPRQRLSDIVGWARGSLQRWKRPCWRLPGERRNRKSSPGSATVCGKTGSTRSP
jgi:Xaa-Pro aminopeptidase